MESAERALLRRSLLSSLRSCAIPLVRRLDYFVTMRLCVAPIVTGCYP